MEEESEIPQEFLKSKKKGRKRQLYNNIKELMEFYFSPANLSKDRWISNKLAEFGSIDLTHFLNFNKMRSLTNDVNDIVKALRNSELLEVSDDCKVKLAKPIEAKENVDDCVIYVEQIHPDADHDWLKSFFLSYGGVDYISLPKYSSTKKCKGFGFIEFSNPEGAAKAVEDYKKAGRYLLNRIEPQELLSITTFEQKEPPASTLNVDNVSDKPEIESDTGNKKRKKNDVEDIVETAEAESCKKIKLENAEESSNNLGEPIDPNADTLDENDLTSGTEGFEGKTDESRKKKNRKKKKKTKKNKITPDTTGFQILTKKDWKYLRNKYLNMQKEKMKQLKVHMKKKQFKKNGDYKTKQFNKKRNQTNEEIETPVSKDYIPGIIVKIEVPEPIINVKQFKSDVKNKSEDIKYVDVKEGSFSAFIRLTNAEAAKELCEKSIWNNSFVLKDNEEYDYWDKIEKGRQIKMSKPAKKIKERGKEKLLKKAENLLGKHITFDDNV